MNRVEHFKRIALELCNLYEAKDKCYNNSFGDTYKKLGIISAVTRISDKYNRLCNLATNADIDNLGESLEDTLRDMASYCIMTVMELENERNLLNDKIMRCIEREEGIVDDKPVSEEDNRIHKGDKFLCIQDVVMSDGSVDYCKGGVYLSEKDGCITDLNGDIWHYWDDWRDYFKQIN